MAVDKIPNRTIEERSLPESEHETLRGMAKAYVEQHTSFRKQLRDRLVNDEASQLHEKVRKTTVLLRKLGNLRHEHYAKLVDLDQTIGRKQKLDIAMLILAFSCVVTFALAYFGMMPITTQEVANYINLQAPILYVWGGIIAFLFLSNHFQTIRIMDLRDQASWRMDGVASEIELLNASLSVRFADIWVWADLLYLHSCTEGDNYHLVGFIDRQARRKRLRTPFDISYYGFYPENTFMSFNHKDPRTPELKLLIECKLFIGLMVKHHWEVYWAVHEDWDSKGLQTPESTICDYFAFQNNYEVPPHSEAGLPDNDVL